MGRPNYLFDKKEGLMYTFNFLDEVIHGDKYRAAADIIIDGEPTEDQAEYICNHSCIIFCKRGMFS